MDQRAQHEQLLDRRSQLTEGLGSLPYDLILYLDRAVVYSHLGYPDLAAGDAYRALLLADEAANDSFEYHDRVMESLMMHTATPIPEVLTYGDLPAQTPPVDVSDSLNGETAARRLAFLASIRAYQILSLSLLLCGCLRSAATFCQRALALAPQNRDLLDTQSHIETVARRRLRRHNFETSDLPDSGLVRREVYPWNDHEPDRLSESSLASLNAGLRAVAPKCEVRVAALPVLLEGACDTDTYDIIPTCQQLGVFAREDIEPGDLVLEEYSLLTANNRLRDSVCDACSSDLPPLRRGGNDDDDDDDDGGGGGGNGEVPIQCSECLEAVFCSRFCHDEAQKRYHPVVCDKGVDAVAKDPTASEAGETLHLLLLSRLLALAAQQRLHPLQVPEVKYIWGDFVPARANDINVSPNAGPPPEWTLPFSFKYNIETPLHVLEKMEVDIFATLAQHDLWILNTLYAKFRGTASARKNPRDGRPDVAAVHPYWCLANHDCDPNVTWQWGGRMLLRAREDTVAASRGQGIRRGDEILNHYCDVTLPVQERREWARGSLGGWCMCRRCRAEAAAATAATAADAADASDPKKSEPDGA